MSRLRASSSRASSSRRSRSDAVQGPTGTPASAKSRLDEALLLPGSRVMALRTSGMLPSADDAEPTLSPCGGTPMTLAIPAEEPDRGDADTFNGAKRGPSVAGSASALWAKFGWGDETCSRHLRDAGTWLGVTGSVAAWGRPRGPWLGSGAELDLLGGQAESPSRSLERKRMTTELAQDHNADGKAMPDPGEETRGDEESSHGPGECIYPARLWSCSAAVEGSPVVLPTVLTATDDAPALVTAPSCLREVIESDLFRKGIPFCLDRCPLSVCPCQLFFQILDPSLSYLKGSLQSSVGRVPSSYGRLSKAKILCHAIKPLL
ncbi:hypothetical protein LRP88_02032 [Fusarium phalaenopsidis]